MLDLNDSPWHLVLMLTRIFRFLSGQQQGDSNPDQCERLTRLSDGLPNIY
uniref:Uncharacterized protein n=1 Tax=Rhizophora mucronata TaxID=61149 RepID=A0A2P2PCR6_RHIMU